MEMNRQKRNREESILRRGELTPEEMPPGISIEMLQDFGFIQGSASPEETLAAQECARLAIGMLNPAAQRLIKMRFYSDMTFGQMGDELGMNESQAFKATKAALKKLRELISSRKVESVAA